MSAYAIVVEDNCYGIRKGSRFQQLSNCTFRLRMPVLAGTLSGYLAEAIHKDGNVKEFFYPKGMVRMKVESFVAIMNKGDESSFFKRFTLQLTSVQLDALLTEMETAVEIPENIPKAVSVVGRNVNQQGDQIWALNRELFIDGKGNIVKPEDHGLCWIGHLVNKDPENLTANEERSAAIHLPLTANYFDLMCHFLKGNLHEAFKNQDLRKELIAILQEVGVNEEVVGHKGQENKNFLPTFYTAAMSIVIAHYDKWQKLAGLCPIPAALGEPDSGKSTACKFALAITGGWRANFFASVSEKVSGRVASQTTMGYVIDDPTRPQDVGEAAKKFFNDGSNINCHGQWSPQCCPLFSLNNHVLDWLSKPEKERLLSRILFIPFATNSTKATTDEQAAIWQLLFNALLERVSSAVAEVVKVGDWLMTSEGKQNFNECLGIVTKGFGEEHCQGSRFAKMWACALLSARKMQELTETVNDQQVIDFFMSTIVPHVLRFQKPILFGRRRVSGMAQTAPAQAKEHFIEKLEQKLEAVLDEGIQPTEALQFVRSDVTTNKLSGTEGPEAVIAIRAEKFQQQCEQKEMTPIKAADLRTSVQAYSLGTKKAEQRFHSPTAGKRKLKSCIFIKRSLFKSSTLERIDQATGLEKKQVGGSEQSTASCLVSEGKPSDEAKQDSPSSLSIDLQNLKKERDELKKVVTGMKKEYEEEIERLKRENSQLKTRLRKEMDEKEKLEEEVKKLKEQQANGQLREGSASQDTAFQEQQANGQLREGSASQDTAFQAATEMLQIEVSPLLISRKNKDYKDTCPLCHSKRNGEWQQCTITKCGQWVHCRCEAESDTTYRCPECKE